MPASWKNVLAYSILHAFAIVFVRVIWITYFGSPDWFTAATEAEEIARNDKPIPISASDNP